MGICPNCGSWIDEGDICSCCGDSGSYGYENDNDDEDNDSITKANEWKSKEYSKKAWKYYLDFKDEDALYFINLALKLNDKDSNNWNIKAMIFESMKKYEQSEEYYNQSLELSSDRVVSDNKARMLLSWAHQLLEESKEVPNGIKILEDAKKINFKAINARPGESSEENLEKFLNQRDTINFYIDYERKFQRKLETLKSFDKNQLFTITGRDFYKNNIPLFSDMPLKLIKEPDNEFDKNAIAVYANDKKIGYVANKEYTKYELTSSASELQDKMENTAEGCFLFYLERYADIGFLIGRLIK